MKKPASKLVPRENLDTAPTATLVPRSETVATTMRAVRVDKRGAASPELPEATLTPA